MKGKALSHNFAMLTGLLLTCFTCSCGQIVDCKDTILSESVSPDQNLIATVFERDCGATTAKNIQIALRPGREKFSAKRHPSFAVFETDKVVTAAWTNNSLLITIPSDAHSFRQEK